jgi:hypothetical protein
MSHSHHGGGFYLQGMDKVPQGPSAAGKFGRMFRELPIPENVDEEALRVLGDSMRDELRGAGDNPDIPSGYTYLGQFIDHDITFDITPLNAAQNDPEGIVNLRTPGLDLDSVYGAGREQSPFMYDQGSPGAVKLLVVKGEETPPGIPRGDDLPRVDQTPEGAEDRRDVAVIGDPRNDENLIVSQLHVLFLKFHNRMVDMVAERDAIPDDQMGARSDDVFKEAQRLTRWHYQWVVANDFVRRVCGGAMTDAILRPPDPDGGVPLRRVVTEFYPTGGRAFIPLEFAAAVYRMGHSMIRGIYSINTTITNRPIFDHEAAPQPTRQDFRGRRRLPAFWDFEWGLLFDGVPASDEARRGDLPLQNARLIDTKLAQGLFELIGEAPDSDGARLSRRNLLRGARLQLPAGQTVASAMGQAPLGPDDLGFTALGLPADMPAPLWYYVLREAEIATEGRHLGPVGGRIVAEVLLGLIAMTPLSFMRVAPNWLPELSDTDGDGTFTMTDFVNVAAHGMGSLSAAAMAPAHA